MSKKIPEFIMQRFGITVEEIIKNKTEGTQKRDFANAGMPEAVTMTADECKAFCQKTGVVYKEGYEGRIIRYTCSDSSVDRMGDVIKQEGWKLENYEKNPVIMGFHNYGTFPVGSALKTYVEDGKLKMYILFPDKDVSEDADKAFRIAKAGFMKAGSVGFLPLKYHFPEKKEREELGMPEQYGVVFDEQELLEFSVCGVPANANAIQESIAKGITAKTDWQKWIDENTYTSLKDVAAEPPPEVKECEECKKRTSLKKEMMELLATQKQGAVLSKKTKDAINKSIDTMRSAVDALEQLLKDASKEDEDFQSDKGEEPASTFDIDLETLEDTEKNPYPESSIEINI